MVVLAFETDEDGALVGYLLIAGDEEDDVDVAIEGATE